MRTRVDDVSNLLRERKKPFPTTLLLHRPLSRKFHRLRWLKRSQPSDNTVEERAIFWCCPHQILTLNIFCQSSIERAMPKAQSRMYLREAYCKYLVLDLWIIDPILGWMCHAKGTIEDVLARDLLQVLGLWNIDNICHSSIERAMPKAQSRMYLRDIYRKYSVSDWKK